MNRLFFWKNWNAPYSHLYFFLFTLFCLLLLLMGYSSFVGIEGVVKWEVETEVEPVKVVIDKFSQNLLNFSVETESYYALDRYVTSGIQLNLWVTYIYLGIIVIGILFLLTTMSFLDLYWFMGAVLVFLSFLVSLKIELLELFGRTDSIPMIALFLAYGALSFYFNAFQKNASFIIRLLSFTLLTVVVAAIIFKFSKVATPFLYLANYGSLFPVALSVLFMLMVGHDTIKGFLYIVSSKSTAASKNTLLNFFFASLLYLVNVLLLLFKKLYVFELDIVYINPFLLVAVSSILGIWMFRKRTEMFSTVLPFAPAGAFTYLSIAIIVVAGMGYALFSGNIGMTEAYERIIVYGHLFVGFVFLIYVIVNFGHLFSQKVSIFDQVYNPIRLTYLIVPVAAISISSFFFLYQRKYPYNLAMAGYYTFAGDVMVYENQTPLALRYYEQAVGYDFPNHRANYSIASLTSSLEDKETAKGYLENALYRDPTVQSYIDLSNCYFDSGELFNALFKLQDGLKRFPGDERLYTNLGVMFYKSNIPDSSLYYLSKAKEISSSRDAAASNMLYVYAKTNRIAEADSIIQSEPSNKNISFANNSLAILNQLGRKSTSLFNVDFVKDTVLNANTFAYLINSSINSLKDTSPVVYSTMFEMKSKISNELFKDRLAAQLAVKKYYSGDRFGGIQDMIQINAVSNQAFNYSSLLGYWMLEQEQYLASSDYFREASKAGNSIAQINYAITSALSGNKNEALFILSQLKNSADKDISKISDNLVKILLITSISDVLNLEESERLQYLLFVLDQQSETNLLKIYASLKNDQAKVIAASALCKWYIQNFSYKKAVDLYVPILGIQQLNTYAENERNFTLLLLKSVELDKQFLKENASTLSLNSDKELWRDYFVGASYEAIGDTSNAARFYLSSITKAPEVTFALSKSVIYIAKHGQPQTAYNLLVEIVQNNPTVSLRKIYLELCLELGLVSYSESTLKDLTPYLSSTDLKYYTDRYMAIQQ